MELHLGGTKDRDRDMQNLMAFNPLQLCAHSFHEVELDSMDSYALSDHQKHPTPCTFVFPELVGSLAGTPYDCGSKIVENRG